MDYNKLALENHEKFHGKIEIALKEPLQTLQDLSWAYTPGVAAPCMKIKNDPSLASVYTLKHNTVAVVSDGSAVLGLGNIGALAAIPVMEGKAALFKRFGGVDAVPICIDTQDTDEIVRTVQLIAPCFGGVNLEDISAPRCFEIERRLKETLSIPIFHDDQHGTAIVVAAALISALKVVSKKIEDVRIVVSGVGAAGCSVIGLLEAIGAKNIIPVNSKGILTKESARDEDRKNLAIAWNPAGRVGTLADAMAGTDVFIGVSAPGIVSREMVASMNRDAIVLAMSNPEPEILPDAAIQAGAKIVGTGRSDYPNQVNNSVAFPGVFRGALDAGARKITEEMKIAAALALAGIVGEDCSEEYIIPSMLDERVVPAVSAAVAKAWRQLNS